MYNCYQCDGSFILQGNLHKKAKHKGIKYNCDQCDGSFTQQYPLSIHNKSKHEGVKY